MSETPEISSDDIKLDVNGNYGPHLRPYDIERINNYIDENHCVSVSTALVHIFYSGILRFDIDRKKLIETLNYIVKKLDGEADPLYAIRLEIIADHAIDSYKRKWEASEARRQSIPYTAVLRRRSLMES